MLKKLNLKSLARSLKINCKPKNYTMKSILSFAFLFTILGIKAQNNVVVFSENGEKFFLIINGVKQNIESETNVKVTDLIQPNYKAKIVFEDKAKGVVDQNIYFMDGGEPVKNHEFVFSVSVSKKGGYKARPVSMVSIADTKTDPAQTVVHYSTTEPTQTNNNVVSDGNSSTTNVHVTETTTQTQVNQGATNNSNVGVNINGMGVNININDNMGGMNGGTSVTSQTVSTKTANSGMANNSAAASNATTSNKATTSSTKNTNAVTGYAGPAGCTAPMSNTEFASVKKTIEAKDFEESKIKIAKQIIDNNCLLSSQVKEIMVLFNFDETRLDLAKYAYGHTYDIGNYYKLNDAFKFESSIDELDQHIKASKTH